MNEQNNHNVIYDDNLPLDGGFRIFDCPICKNHTLRQLITELVDDEGYAYNHYGLFICLTCQVTKRRNGNE